MNSRIDKNWGTALGLGLTAAAGIVGASCAASDSASASPPSQTSTPIPAVEADTKPRVARLYSKSLIIGASVSADWGTASPSRRASLRHAKADIYGRSMSCTATCYGMLT